MFNIEMSSIIAVDNINVLHGQRNKGNFIKLDSNGSRLSLLNMGMNIQVL